MTTSYQKVEYDMSKYDWDVIAQQTADIYRALKDKK